MHARSHAQNNHCSSLSSSLAQAERLVPGIPPLRLPAWHPNTKGPTLFFCHPTKIFEILHHGASRQASCLYLAHLKLPSRYSLSTKKTGKKKRKDNLLLLHHIALDCHIRLPSPCPASPTGHRLLQANPLRCSISYPSTLRKERRAVSDLHYKHTNLLPYHIAEAHNGTVAPNMEWIFKSPFNRP